MSPSVQKLAARTRRRGLCRRRGSASSKSFCSSENEGSFLERTGTKTTLRRWALSWRRKLPWYPPQKRTAKVKKKKPKQNNTLKGGKTRKWPLITRYRHVCSPVGQETAYACQWRLPVKFHHSVIWLRCFFLFILNPVPFYTLAGKTCAVPGCISSGGKEKSFGIKLWRT